MIFLMGIFLTKSLVRSTSFDRVRIADRFFLLASNSIEFPKPVLNCAQFHDSVVVLVFAVVLLVDPNPFPDSKLSSPDQESKSAQLAQSVVVVVVVVVIHSEKYQLIVNPGIRSSFCVCESFLVTFLTSSREFVCGYV